MYSNKEEIRKRISELEYLYKNKGISETDYYQKRSDIILGIDKGEVSKEVLLIKECCDKKGISESEYWKRRAMVLRGENTDLYGDIRETITGNTSADTNIDMNIYDRYNLHFPLYGGIFNLGIIVVSIFFLIKDLLYYRKIKYMCVDLK